MKSILVIFSLFFSASAFAGNLPNLTCVYDISRTHMGWDDEINLTAIPVTFTGIPDEGYKMKSRDETLVRVRAGSNTWSSMGGRYVLGFAEKKFFLLAKVRGFDEPFYYDCEVAR